jgi:hypothetical protein
MVEDKIRRAVYVALRGHPGDNSVKILERVRKTIPKARVSDIFDVLEEGQDNGHIVSDGNGFKLPIVFDSVMIKNGRPVPGKKRGFWDWEIIQQMVAPQTATTPLPEEWINPAAYNVYWRDQSGQGYCVGFSAANCHDVVYNMMHPEDAPTTAQLKDVKRNIPIVLGPDNTSYDLGPPQASSGASAYHTSRSYDPTIGPMGSYIDLVMKAWKEFGFCRDAQWLTSKSGRSEWVLPYPDKDPITGVGAKETAATQKIGGYAAVSATEQMKRAMYGTDGKDGSGCIECAIVVYENYMNGQSDGVFPMPRGQSVGGHALAIVGWNKLGFVIHHTWQGEGWPQFGCIPYDYLQYAGIGAFVPISPNMAKYIRENIYRSVSVTTNMEADIYLDGKFAGKTAGNKFDMALLQNTTCSVMGKSKSTGESITKSVSVTPELTTINLQFKVDTPPIPPTPPSPGNAFSAKMAAAIKAMLEKLKKIFGR